MKISLKNVLLAGLFGLMLSLPAFSQKGLKVGIIALPQVSYMLNQQDMDSPKDEFTYKTTFGMAGGPSLGYNVSDNFGFRLNFLYSAQGQVFENRNSEGDWVRNVRRLSYIKAPLMIGFNTKTAYSKVIFSIYAGIQGSMLVRAREYDDDQSYTPDEAFNDQITDYPSTYRKYSMFDYGPVADIGIDIKLTYNVMANIHLRADYGLSDAERKEAVYKFTEFGITNNVPIYEADRAETSNITGGILFGITYTLINQ